MGTKPQAVIRFVLWSMVVLLYVDTLPTLSLKCKKKTVSSSFARKNHDKFWMLHSQKGSIFIHDKCCINIEQSAKINTAVQVPEAWPVPLWSYIRMHPMNLKVSWHINILYALFSWFERQLRQKHVPEEWWTNKIGLGIKGQQRKHLTESVMLRWN